MNTLFYAGFPRDTSLGRCLIGQITGYVDRLDDTFVVYFRWAS
jgi:hypothetical protein